MKKSTSVKSKPKFAKKRGNSKQPQTKTTVKPVDKETDIKQTPDAQQKVAIDTTPPPADAKPEVRIGGPTPEVRPCSPAETQKGHHEVVQS